MPEGFEFIAELKDAMSKPAAEIRKAIDELRVSLKGLDGAHKSAGKAVKEHASFLDDFGKSLIPEIAAAELAADAIKELGRAAVEAFKFGLEASEMKEEAVQAYTVIRGTAEEGERTFASLEKLGKGVHMPAEEVHKLAQELMLQGLTEQENVEAAIAATAALQRTGMKEGAEKYKAIVERSLATGAFALPKKSIAGMGIHVDEVYADIGKRLHKSQAQVKADIARGVIDAKTGIAALTDAINKGPAGQLAAKRLTLTDAIVDMKNEMRGMFEDMNTGPLVTAIEGIKTIFGDTDVKSFFNTVIAGFAQVVKFFTILTLKAETFYFKVHASVMGVIAGIERFAGFDPRQLTPKMVAGKVEDAALTVGKEAGRALPGVGVAINAYDAAKAVWSSVMGDGKPAPAHAAGGMVMQPAPGEVMASVAPGEMILPADFEMGGSGKTGTVVHVDVGGLHVHGVHDPAQVLPLIESQVTDIFERVALELGG